MKPTKENTLYLTIKQKYFDEIVAGTKMEEYREIKDTTYKKYLECAENGAPYFYTDKIDPKDPNSGNIYTWNGGDYPFVPKASIEYLSLAVGYAKERDTAIVEVEDMTFEPMQNKMGKPARFKDEDGFASIDDNGDLCFWNVVFHLGKVIEVHRK